MGTSSGAYALNHECAKTRTSTHNLFRDKIRANMYYFASNTTAPLQCATLVFLIAYVDRMSFG